LPRTITRFVGWDVCTNRTELKLEPDTLYKSSVQINNLKLVSIFYILVCCLIMQWLTKQKYNPNK